MSVCVFLLTTEAQPGARHLGGTGTDYRTNNDVMFVGTTGAHIQRTAHSGVKFWAACVQNPPCPKQPLVTCQFLRLEYCFSLPRPEHHSIISGLYAL